MRLAYVVPRYGTEVVGGAEFATRMLAERLAARPGWEVEVLTTAALETTTWADHYPAGTSALNGVTVRRFPSASGRDPGFERLSQRVLADPRRATPTEGRQWIDLQGPRNPELVAAAAASAADVVAFYPYLYHPTVHGLPAVGRRAVLHPAAHDEPPLRLPLFQPVFAAASGLVFQTRGERRLVERLFPVAGTRQLEMGLGVEEGQGEPDAARETVAGLGDRPYLLYVGRVDDGKGTAVLSRFFAAYKARRPGSLALVVAGPVIDPPPPAPDVLVIGPVDEPVKWGLLRGARAFVHPSAYEAFSLALVEAWAAGRPVLVNARCSATREHCERSGGGLWYDGYAAFEAGLDRMLGDDDLLETMARRGADYVARTFRWPSLIGRYATFLEAVAARA